MNNGNSNNNNRNNANRVRPVAVVANEPKTYDIPFDSIVEAFYDCIATQSSSERGEEGQEKEDREVGETEGECAYSSCRHSCLRDFFADSQKQPSSSHPAPSCRLILRPAGIRR